MRNARHGVAICVIAVVPFLLTACGGGEDPPAAPTQDQAQPAAPQTQAPAQTTPQAAAPAAPAPAPAPSPEQAARQALPDHDPDARYQGKTALEYAADLTDMSERVQMTSLYAISQFRVNGLPARDQVRAVLGRDVTDQVRVAAITTLGAMRAPEAPALLREKLIDPDFSDNPRTYALLVAAAPDMGVDEATLTADMLGVVRDNFNHAERIMLTRSLPAGAQEELTQAVFAMNHGPASTQYFIQRLGELEYLEGAQRAAYVERHLDAARQRSSSVHEALLAIGTLDAMNAALRLNDDERDTLDRQYRLMIRYAATSVGPREIFDRMLRDALAAPDRADADNITAYMDLLPREMATAQQRARGQGGPDMAEVKTAYIETIQILLATGPTPEHRALAASRLVGFLGANDDVPLDPTLEPVYEAIADPASEPVLRDTAAAAIRNHAGRFLNRGEEATAYLIRRGADVLMGADDFLITRLGADLLTGVLGRPGAETVVCEAVLDRVDAGFDSMSPASIASAVTVLLEVCANRNLVRSELKERASPVVSAMLLDPRLDPGYVVDPVRSRFPSLVDRGANTFPGVIAALEPHLTDDGASFVLEVARTYVVTTLRHPLSRIPAEHQQQWRAMLEKGARCPHPQIADAARAGLAG